MDRKKIFDLLLSCVRFSVKKEPFPENMALDLTEEEAEELYRISDRQDLAHLVGFALEENKLLSLAGKAAPKFKKKMMFALYRSEQIEYERQALCDFLEELKIPHIPLKGAVIRSFYPETWMRTSSDADVLIPEEKLKKAISLLREKRGYVILERGSHDVTFRTPVGMHIELHFDLVERERMPEAASVLKRVWEYATPCPGRRWEKQMTPEIFLFYHIVHMAKHLNNGGVGIRFFLDYDLIREGMHPDEALLSQLLKKGRVAVFEKKVRGLSRAWFRGEKMGEEEKLLESFVLSTGVFGELQNYVAIRRGRKGKVRYLWERLISPYDSLCQTYPNLEGKKYLLPYYQALRMAHHIKSGGMKRSMREVQKNLSLSPGERDRMARLLKAMDLHFYD